MMIFEKLLCTMMSQVVLFAYRMKLNILRMKEVLYQRGDIVILSDLCDAIKNVRKSFVA